MNRTKDVNETCFEDAGFAHVAQATDEMKLLPETFKPGPMDVICARGHRAFNHPGNRHFRHLVKAHLDDYSKALSKLDKSLIVSNIVEAVRQASPEGGFVKEEDGRWFEVGDHNAREKTGQNFRNLLHFKYKSSTKAKTFRRKQVQNQMVEGKPLSIEKQEKQGPCESVKDLHTCNEGMTGQKESIDVLFDKANRELLRLIKGQTNLHGPEKQSWSTSYVGDMIHRPSPENRQNFPRTQIFTSHFCEVQLYNSRNQQHKVDSIS